MRVSTTVPVSASAYKKTAIEKFQAAGNPSQPLDRLSEAERNEAWVRLCEKIEEAMGK